MTEAFTLLYLRDRGKLAAQFWLSMLLYVSQYIYSKGLLDTARLPPHHHAFMVDLTESDAPLRAFVQKLVERESADASR